MATGGFRLSSVSAGSLVSDIACSAEEHDLLVFRWQSSGEKVDACLLSAPVNDGLHHANYLRLLDPQSQLGIGG